MGSHFELPLLARTRLASAAAVVVAGVVLGSFGTREQRLERVEQVRLASTGALTVIGPRGRTALEIRLVRLGRTASTVTLEPPATVAGDEVALKWGGLIERRRQRGRSVEQSWDLTAPPRGHGPLTLELSVEGFAHRGQSERGHRFSHPATGQGLLYGPATWVDARGRRRALITERTTEGLAIVVPAELLEVSAFPATIDPLISSEIILDDAQIVTASRTAQTPSAAYDGANFLVVWVDRRGGIGQFYATRVAPDGTLLTPGGIALFAPPGLTGGPVVAFDGAHFVISWTDASGAHAARVATDGAVLDPGGFPLSPSVAGATAPAIASGGGITLVAWAEPGAAASDFRLAAARVDGAGAVLDPAGLTLATATGSEPRPAVSTDGTDFLVSWKAGQRIIGARVTAGGVVLDPAGFTISDAGTEPASAFGGGFHFVTWSNYPNLEGTRVAPDGSRPDAVPRVLPTWPGTKSSSTVAFDGSNFLVGWFSEISPLGSWDIMGLRVAPSGVEVDSSAFIIGARPGVDLNPRVAAGGGRFLVAWESPNPGNVAMSRVSAAGALQNSSTGVTLSLAANEQSGPAVAFDGVTSLAVWQDWRNANPAIYGMLFSPAGPVLDGGIAVATQSWAQSETGLAFDGTNYLVVWNNPGEGVFASRVSTSGAVLDPGGLTLKTRTGYSYNPSVAAGTGGFLVAWTDTSAFPFVERIRAQRVSSGGRVLDGGELIVAAETWPQAKPKVGFDGTNYLVVWARPPSADAGIVGARVSVTGEKLDDAGFSMGESPQAQWAPDLAFDGMQYLVVWSDGRNDGGTDIYGTRVTPSGVALDPQGLAISTAPGDERSPVVTFDGLNFLVAWQTISGISGTWVSSAGVVLQPAGFRLADVTYPRWSPFGLVATSPAGHAVVAYQTYDSRPGVTSVRARARFIEGRGTASPCAVDSECASGSCVGGRCCAAFCADGTCDAGGCDPIPDGGSAPKRFTVGCGCSSGSDLGWLAALAALGLLSTSRKREPGRSTRSAACSSRWARVRRCWPTRSPRTPSSR